MQGLISYVGLISIFFLVHAVSGQSTRSNPRDVVVESNRQELDDLLLRKPILTTEDKRARQAVLREINDDFKALQVLNNRLMTEATEPTQVNYKSLSKLLSEIGSKASRLKSNLLLPRVETDKQPDSKAKLDASNFRGALEAFDKVVVNFATNPIFQKANVIEVELAKQASRDLATIIDQSGRLKKAAMKLVNITKQ